MVFAPVVVALLVTVVVVGSRGPVVAAWHANLGAVAQARADFGDGSTGTPPGEAERQFTLALAAMPADAPALRRLGILELDLDRHAEALAHLAAAYTADGSNVSTRKAYGLAAMWTGDIELAARLLNGLPAISDELTAWSNWRRSRADPQPDAQICGLDHAHDSSLERIHHHLRKCGGGNHQTETAAGQGYYYRWQCEPGPIVDEYGPDRRVSVVSPALHHGPGKAVFPGRDASDKAAAC